MSRRPSRVHVAGSILLLAWALTTAAPGSRAADAAAGAEKRTAAATKGLAKLSERLRGTAQQKEPQVGVVAVNSFTGLAFLSSGSTAEAGDYARDVRECLDQVLKSADAKNGLIHGPGPAPMYDHGFATLFLAEVYAKQPDGARKEEIGQVLGRAVELIAKAQNAEGGWRYTPTPFDADVSVSACQTVALTAAQRAGMKLPERTLDRALAYLRKCQNEDGGFRYIANANSASGFPRSAAAAAALAHVNGANDQDVRRALKYLSGPLAKLGAEEGHLYYGRYYAAQALHAMGDASQAQYAALCDDLLNRQTDDGTWHGDLSDTYATAMALIALQAGDGKLLIMQPVKAEKK